MSTQKSTKAERLFDAIGMIDEIIITEAQTPYARKRREMSTFRGVIALACTLVICITVGVGTFFSSDFVKEDGMDIENSFSDNAVSAGSAFADSLLILDDEKVVVCSGEELDFFNGVMSIIWCTDNNNGEYRVIELDSGESDIRRELLNTGKQLSNIESKSISCNVWISYGNGEIVSPYLKYTQGNVGYGELFEYSPEYEPTENFVKLISNLIS